MNKLKIVSRNGQLVTDSREVAKMTDQNHKELLRTIRLYVETLGERNFAPSNFFIESHYRSLQNKKLPCYLLTRKGCDMVANKMTGEKGVLFTAEYVTRFEQMEQQQPKVLSDKEQLMASMKLSLEANETLEKHGERITNLEETMRIDGSEEFEIRKSANVKVIGVLSGKQSPAYKELNRKVFAAFWRDFKKYFVIPRYGDLPKKKFEEGLSFISYWQPETSLRIEIDNMNRQETFDKVL